MSFFTALQFLTTISLPWRRDAGPEAMGRSLSYFPLVGLVIGVVLAALSWLLFLALPPAVVNALLIVALVIITGALHLDGLADTCDGLAGHKPTEERWRVMHDSHSGAFCVVGIVLLLLVKYVALNSIPAPILTKALLLAPVVSRWAMVYSIFAYPYARPSGLGKAFKDGAHWRRFTVATLITLALALVLLQLAGLLIIIVVWLVTAGLAGYFKSKFNGLTGDTYGAVNEIAETGVFLLISFIAHTGLIWLGEIIG